jgi:hypothetical protein
MVKENVSPWQRRMPAAKVAALAYAIHQITALVLFMYEFPRAKNGQPLDTLGVVGGVLLFPFYIVGHLDKDIVVQLPESLVVPFFLFLFFLSGVIWATIVLLLINSWKRYRTRTTTAAI